MNTHPALRELTAEEIHAVAGGASNSDIVVTGYRLEFTGLSSGSGGHGNFSGLEDTSSLEPGEEFFGPKLPLLYDDCDKENKALEVATAMKASGITFLELGATLFTQSDGSVGASDIAFGQIDQRGDLTVRMNLPAGTDIINMLGTVHTHPQRAPTDDEEFDRAVNIADQYPSPGDWTNMGIIASSVITAGGNPNQLSIYIVDRFGFVREFNYADRHIYDVPVEQLLQEPGTPPLPPLPQAILLTKDCGS